MCVCKYKQEWEHECYFWKHLKLLKTYEIADLEQERKTLIKSESAEWLLGAEADSPTKRTCDIYSNI